MILKAFGDLAGKWQTKMDPEDTGRKEKRLNTDEQGESG
jgi:hypothetical protein